MTDDPIDVEASKFTHYGPRWMVGTVDDAILGLGYVPTPWMKDELLGRKESQLVSKEEEKSIAELPASLRRVGQAVIVDRGLRVSTVALGIPHGLGRDEFFETMVFLTEGPEDWAEQFCLRYRTWGEAEVGHRAVTACLEVGVLIDDLHEMVDGVIGRLS